MSQKWDGYIPDKQERALYELVREAQERGEYNKLSPSFQKERPRAWSIVKAVDSVVHAYWIGFYNPDVDALVSTTASVNVDLNIVCQWRDVESWEEIS